MTSSTSFDISKAVFVGKFAFILPDDNNLIGLATTAPETALNIQAGDSDNPTTSQLFNLYGDLKTGFVMQAPNWSYVDYNSGYVANKKRTATGLSVFYFQTIDDFSTYIIEKVDGTEYFLNAKDKTLERIAKTAKKPPPTAIFQQTIITDGVVTMQNQGSTLANPLTGVYLAGQNLSTVSFQATDISFADFTGTNLSGVNLNGATAENTSFDEAIMPGVIANGLNFKNCTFVKANMQYVKLVGSVLNGCNLNLVQFNAPKTPQKDFTNLQQADFTNASLIGCQLGNALVNSAIFNGATLINTDFSKARGVDENLDFRGAILIGANLSGHDLTKAKLDSSTNFMGAILNGCDLSSHDLSNMVFVRAKMQKVKLDNTTLNGAQLAFADLSFVTATGGVSMIGANLSNSILQAAQFPGAQLGAKKILSKLPLSDISVLNNKKVPMQMQDAPLNVPVTATVKVIQPSSFWSIKNGNTVYQINNSGSNLTVQIGTATSNSAILSNAYMPNANFEQANMFAVEMSGAHWYGAGASAKSADLGLANLSNSNLNGMTFTQAQMQGASFDFAQLIGTKFKGTSLSPSANLKPTSFAFASMQSTQFKETNLFSANLTNAAYALENGVPLFSIDKNLLTTLNKKVVSSDLQTAFSNSAYMLTSAASISVDKASSIWTINNIDSDDDSQTGYGNFKLVYKKDINGLESIQVNGAHPLLILQADGKGGQSQIQLDFGPTELSCKQMNDATTCPSGMKLKLLGNHLTFEELMTAALPPTPPVCENCWGA